MADTYEISEVNIFDQEELHHNCTVQILHNTVTGECSVGWWENEGWISVEERLPEMVWTMAQGIITSATVTRVKSPEITVKLDAFGYGHIRSTDDFGKTVFLTREEAEAALGGNKNG